MVAQANIGDYNKFWNFRANCRATVHACDSKAERGRTGRDAALGPDLGKATSVGHDLTRFVDQQFAAGVFPIKADQRMGIIDKNH